jgi:hypothetical protein
MRGEKSGDTGLNDVFLMLNLPRGAHEVGLKEAPEECRFSANPRSIVVTPGETSETTFLVWCG